MNPWQGARPELVTAAVIKLESSGPILYRQERVGKNGRAFKVMKFRSMRVDAEKTGPVWASKDDDRTTRVRGIVNSVAAYFPDITPAHLKQATARPGLRPCSPDGLPYVGRVARFANLSVATGHAMMGISLGPITGKLMAEILSGDTLSCSMEGLSPDRYA